MSWRFSCLRIVGMPGNRRRSSTAAENSPPWLNAARIAAASASVTTNMSEHGKAGQDRQAVLNPANDLQRDGLLSTIMETRATFPQSGRGKVCNAPCGQQKTKRGTVASKNPQKHNGRDGYRSSVGPDCGDDQKISDRVGQRTSHSLIWIRSSEARAIRRKQPARVRASASQARTVASNGRYATCRGADTSGKQSRSRPFGRPRRRSDADALTSARRTRGQARD